MVNVTTRSNTLPLQKVYSLLLNHESRLDQLQTTTNIASNGNILANYAQSSQSKRKYNSGRGYDPRGRGWGKAPQVVQTSDRGKSKPTCQICGKVGHVAFDY